MGGKPTERTQATWRFPFPDVQFLAALVRSSDSAGNESNEGWHLTGARIAGRRHLLLEGPSLLARLENSREQSGVAISDQRVARIQPPPTSR